MTSPATVECGLFSCLVPGPCVSFPAWPAPRRMRHLPPSAEFDGKCLVSATMPRYTSGKRLSSHLLIFPFPHQALTSHTSILPSSSSRLCSIPGVAYNTYQPPTTRTTRGALCAPACSADIPCPFVLRPDPTHRIPLFSKSLSR